MTRRLIGPFSATMLVVASMVGGGAFTTTGFLLADQTPPLTVLLMWLVGGLIALFGALSYAELVSALPRNGGEYQLLSRIYHPALGFTAGWISLIVGFSAPIAASAIAFGMYLGAVIPGLNETLAGIILILFLSILHGAHIKLGSSIQNTFTVLKVLIVVAFIGGGLFLGSPGELLQADLGAAASGILTPGFAVGLIFVSFAYSGWNGAAYLAGEIKNPQKSLPIALAAGTGLVVLLYLGLNVVFLASSSPEELQGVVEVGHVAAVNLFGQKIGDLLSGVIALLLISSVSAMIMTGPRVYQAIGEDHEPLSFLGSQASGRGPVPAIVLQAIVAISLLLTSSFDVLLTYIGFTLSIFAGLTVFGVFVLRIREPELERPYQAWGYPWTPLSFMALSAWMVVYTIFERPLVALAGVATALSGLFVYILVRWIERRSNTSAKIATRSSQKTLLSAEDNPKTPE